MSHTGYRLCNDYLKSSTKKKSILCKSTKKPWGLTQPYFALLRYEGRGNISLYIDYKLSGILQCLQHMA